MYREHLHIPSRFLRTDPLTFQKKKSSTGRLPPVISCHEHEIRSLLKWACISDAKLKAGFAQLAGHCRIEAVPPSAFLLCAFLSLCFGVGWNPRLVEVSAQESIGTNGPSPQGG